MQTFEKELNPLYKRILELRDFSTVKPQNDLEEEEYPHLERVTELIADSVERQLSRLHKLEIELEEQVKRIEMETDLDSRKDAVSEYNKIMRMVTDQVNRINKELSTLDSPYFGKILFETQLKGSTRSLPIYIGKFALIDPDNYQPLISDWRAPIANLYYENSGPAPNLSYESPTGKKEGDLVQKRQFTITEARIKHIYDAKTGNVAADEFLLAQLNERLGQKLKDIVATIQAQQNDIIRDDINKPVVIQGVAGSGKTTILLHRLAYLFYTYKEKMKPEKSLLIAPNKMFLDYISDVLPSLGVQRVETNTYMFWAKSILGWDDSYILYSGKENLYHKEFKGTIEFLNILDKYLNDLETEILDNIPYVRKDLIERRYYELKNTYPYISMSERLTLSLEFAFAQKQFREQRTGSYTGELEKESQKRKEIQKYFADRTLPVEVYRSMFKKGYLNKEISKYTLEGVKRTKGQKTYRMEDLPAILYTHLQIHGHKEHEKDYVMVDEAQDLSVVQILTLLQIAKNRNITIAGDLAQSIIPPFYIKDWKQVISLFDKWKIEDYSYHQLNRCYRTTIEIIEFANRIFKNRFPESYKLPEAVLRHGEDINVLKDSREISEMSEKEIKSFIDLLKEEFNKGSVTCAVICRNKDHATAVYQKLKQYEPYLERDITDYSSNDYRTGLLVLPVEDAKGLEFDTVVLVDVNEETYPDTELSTRLLYVAVTRALHRLIILENSNTSSLFKIQ